MPREVKKMSKSKGNEDSPSSVQNPPVEPREAATEDLPGDELGPTDSPDSSVDSLTIMELSRLQKEVVELKDRLVRNMAEMDNMKKRMERERIDIGKFANETLMKDLIPVLDSFDKAVESNASLDLASNGLKEGVVMVHKQLLQTLSKHGLVSVESVGKVFDPNLHQAIQRLESQEVKNDTVASEFAKGYTLSGRLVRPAMVSVKVPVA
jgi:molecular chaperone GrpE